MSGQTVKSTKGNGKIIWWMIKEDNSIGLMDPIIKEGILMTKNMVKELWFGVSLKDIEVIGLLGIVMVMANR